MAINERNSITELAHELFYNRIICSACWALEITVFDKRYFRIRVSFCPFFFRRKIYKRGGLRGAFRAGGGEEYQPRDNYTDDSYYYDDVFMFFHIFFRVDKKNGFWIGFSSAENKCLKRLVKKPRRTRTKTKRPDPVFLKAKANSQIQSLPGLGAWQNSTHATKGWLYDFLVPI